jgi:hypothetical protein
MAWTRVYNFMFPRLRRIFLCVTLVAIESHELGYGQATKNESTAIVETLVDHQIDLTGAGGKKFLLDEARSSDYFLLGELHGENEIPALLRTLWPEMWKAGYRHIAAEVSPWAAAQLEADSTQQGPKIVGLWTRHEAKDARAFASPGFDVLWGCDMEELQPELMIRELESRNPTNGALQQMVEITKSGYSREMAAQLLALTGKLSDVKDEHFGGISLRKNLVETLEIELHRAAPSTKMVAQNERELLMKQQLLAHLRRDPGDHSKVLLRFGRNHLHRGYDARGISTLGNFVSEYAIAHDQRVFNVGAFAAGGKESLMGETWDADERGDEPTFALLAEKARFDITVFDLRPLRPLLHALPQNERTALQSNLAYWADAYDALICYRVVSPLRPED